MLDFMVKHPRVTYRGVKGFMKQGNPLDLFGLLMEYSTKSKIAHYVPWKKTVAQTAAFPTEFLLAFDIFPIFPEAFACFSGSAEATQPLIEHAESMGFSRDVCSYMKTSIGANEKKYPTDFGGYPITNMYVASNMVCDTHVKWFENEARRYNVPYFAMDIPSVVSGTDEKRVEGHVDYVVPQWYDLIEFLEKHTKKKFDEKKFMKIVAKSQKCCDLYREIYDYRKRLPAAQYFEFQRNFMLPGGIMWNLDSAIKYYGKVLKKHKQRYDETSFEKTAKREKYRLMWEGITIWYKIDFYNALAKKGARIVHEPYTETIGLLRNKKTHTFDETLRQMSRELMITKFTSNLENRIKYFEQSIDEYHIDGLILHANLSCRPSSTALQDLKEAVQKSKNIPVLILNADMDDPRSFSEGPIMTRVDSFIEMMEVSRQKKTH
jgi:benzoyl-CoA reductase/2-hydroxyglutaryl-CoA dehydratase subunit BcrC/BadD/HgdB